MPICRRTRATSTSSKLVFRYRCVPRRNTGRWAEEGLGAREACCSAPTWSATNSRRRSTARPMRQGQPERRPCLPQPIWLMISHAHHIVPQQGLLVFDLPEQHLQKIARVKHSGRPVVGINYGNMCRRAGMQSCIVARLSRAGQAPPHCGRTVVSGLASRRNEPLVGQPVRSVRQRVRRRNGLMKIHSKIRGRSWFERRESAGSAMRRGAWHRISTICSTKRSWKPFRRAIRWRFVSTRSNGSNRGAPMSARRRRDELRPRSPQVGGTERRRGSTPVAGPRVRIRGD